MSFLALWLQCRQLKHEREAELVRLKRYPPHLVREVDQLKRMMELLVSAWYQAGGIKSSSENGVDYTLVQPPSPAGRLPHRE